MFIVNCTILPIDHESPEYRAGGRSAICLYPHNGDIRAWRPIAPMDDAAPSSEPRALTPAEIDRILPDGCRVNDDGSPRHYQRRGDKLWATGGISADHLVDETVGGVGNYGAAALLERGDWWYCNPDGSRRDTPQQPPVVEPRYCWVEGIVAAATAKLTGELAAMRTRAKAAETSTRLYRSTIEAVHKLLLSAVTPCHDDGVVSLAKRLKDELAAMTRRAEAAEQVAK